jgi:hypothetical protein
LQSSRRCRRYTNIIVIGSSENYRRTNLPRDGCPHMRSTQCHKECNFTWNGLVISEERAYLAREPRSQMLFRDLARQDLEQDYGVRWPKG